MYNPSELPAIGMVEASPTLNWDEKDPNHFQVWVGPMRLVPNGCKLCRNAGYETFSTRHCGEIQPERTTDQPLAALKVIPEGARLWGKSAFVNRHW